MRVVFTHVTTNICSNPVRNILLVHWVSVRLVSSWPRNIDTLRFHRRLNTKSELGDFTLRILKICWIFEIEISQDFVSVWCRRKLEGTLFFSPYRSANRRTLLPVWVTLRLVSLRSNRTLNSCCLIPELVLFGEGRQLTNFEVGNRGVIVAIISARTRHSIIYYWWTLIVSVIWFHLSSENLVKSMGFQRIKFMRAWSRVTVSTNSCSHRVFGSHLEGKTWLQRPILVQFVNSAPRRVLSWTRVISWKVIKALANLLPS